MIFLPIFLLFAFTGGGLSDFTLSPKGDGIAVVFCKLAAPKDAIFSSSVAFFKQGENGTRIEVSDVRKTLGDRFHGSYFPDEQNRSVLIATVTIRGYTEADLELDLFCSAVLKDENHTVVQLPLKLEEEKEEESCPECLCTCPQPIKPIIMAAGVVIGVGVVLTTLLFLGINITIAVIYVYRKRRTQTYQTEDASGEQQTEDASGKQQTEDASGKQQTEDASGKQQTEDASGKQQSPASSYHTPGAIHTGVEDTQNETLEEICFPTGTNTGNTHPNGFNKT